ncbi:MAG: cupin domain-containing protein [Gammaproteobacteria bacterium]|nr:cupin domain-containing protein [Gammaproteobacteria bacterium]MDH3856767.1 cupin domain-containing protein [Gammaproteobacteria bacterium]
MKETFSRFEINPAAGMQPSSFTSADAFTTDDKTEVNHFYYATDDESILTGVWECAPCKEVFDPYPVHEMMTVLSGSVTLTGTDDGRSETFTAGDTFFVAKGTRCTWEITETLRKYYFIAA